VGLLALCPLAGLAQLFDGLLELVLDVLVARDLEGHAARAAVAHQVVVDLPSRVVRLLHVVVQLLVLSEPLDVGACGVDRAADHVLCIRHETVLSFFSRRP